MSKPILTRNRVIAAYAVAVLADLIELPVTAAEVTVVAAPPAEGVALVVDAIVFGIMTKLLGFHWALLPSFLVEVVPGLDMLPTWVGCVFFVVRQRRKGELESQTQITTNEPRLLIQENSTVKPPKLLKDDNIIDVEEIS